MTQLAPSLDLDAVQSSIKLARDARITCLKMVHKARASHVGACLSMVDILAVLYGGFMNVNPNEPKMADRDRFILSKGHATAGLYAVLAETGFIERAELDHYGKGGSMLQGHASHHVPGIELSTGSLGHGLPVACGMALAAKRDALPWRAFVVLSDGELNEGSNWESFLFAPHHKLDNLTVFIDYNKIQSFGRVSEVLELHPLADKFRAFNWSVHEIDGHDHNQLHQTLNSLPAEPGKPNLILAHTIKGKGVSYMEDTLEWHYKCPNEEQLAQAIKELEASA